jgi:hypothetical protein
MPVKQDWWLITHLKAMPTMLHLNNHGVIGGDATFEKQHIPMVEHRILSLMGSGLSLVQMLFSLFLTLRLLHFGFELMKLIQMMQKPMFLDFGHWSEHWKISFLSIRVLCLQQILKPHNFITDLRYGL